MPKKRRESAQDAALRKRVALIYELSGLEIQGFAEYVGMSRSQLYAILNGNRPLSTEMAHRIGKGFKLTVSQIFDLDYEISPGIRAVPALRDFMARERSIPEYFTHTKDARKASYYIEHELIHADIFKRDTPVYLWQIREYCFERERYYSADQLSKLLWEQVKKGKLISKKRPLLLRDGSYGTRLVNVFFKVSCA